MAALMILGAVAGIGKYMSSIEPPEKTVTQSEWNAPHYESIYEARTVEPARQTLQQESAMRMEDAQRPDSRFVLPHSSLFEDQKALARSNMIPFHRGMQSKQNMDMGRAGHMFEQNIGVTPAVMAQKMETGSFFSTTDRQVAPGSDPTQERDMDRLRDLQSRLRHTETLAEPERVAPGLQRVSQSDPNVKYDTQATGGRHEVYRPPVQQPHKTTLKERPLIEGRMNHGKYGSERGLVGDMPNRRPPRFRAQSEDDVVANRSAMTKTAYQSDQARTQMTQREAKFREYDEYDLHGAAKAAGFGKPSMPGEHTANNRFERDMGDHQETGQRRTDHAQDRRDTEFHLPNTKFVEVSYVPQAFRNRQAPVRPTQQRDMKQALDATGMGFVGKHRTKHRVHDPNDVPDATIKEGLLGEHERMMSTTRTKARVYDPNDVPDATLKDALLGEYELQVSSQHRKHRVHDPDDAPSATLKQGLLGEHELQLSSQYRKHRVHDPDDLPSVTLKEGLLGEHELQFASGYRKHRVHDPDDAPSATLKQGLLGEHELQLSAQYRKHRVHDPEDTPSASLKQGLLGEHELQLSSQHRKHRVRDPDDLPSVTLKEGLLGEHELHLSSQHRKHRVRDPDDLPSATLKEGLLGEHELQFASGYRKHRVHDPDDAPSATLKEGLLGEHELHLSSQHRKHRVHDPDDAPSATLKQGLLGEHELQVSSQYRKHRVHDPNDIADTTMRQTTSGEWQAQVDTTHRKHRVHDPRDRPDTTLKDSMLHEVRAGAGGVGRSISKLPVYDPDDVLRATGKETLDDLPVTNAVGQSKGNVFRGSEQLLKSHDRVSGSYVGQAGKNRGSGYLTAKWQVRFTPKAEQLRSHTGGLKGPSRSTRARSAVYQMDTSGGKEKTLVRYAPTPTGLKSFVGKDHKYGDLIQQLSAERRQNVDVPAYQMPNSIRSVLHEPPIPVSKSLLPERADDFQRHINPFMPRNDLVIVSQVY